MNYPNLTQALNQYCSYIQSVFKSNVQYRTGALRDSIKVWCDINGQSFQLHISLLDYWKYLPNPFPLKEVLSMVEPLTLVPSSSRYPLDFSSWQQRLNQAYESDVLLFLNS